jgi:hypothetical protein
MWKSVLRSVSVVLLATSLLGTPTQAFAQSSDNPSKDPLVFLGSKTDMIVGLFANYFQTVDGLISIAQWADNIFNSSPSIADLLNQIEENIVSELRSERDDNLTWAAEGYMDRFHEVLMNPGLATLVPPSQTVDNILSDASGTLRSMHNIITGPSLVDAYRIAPHYVALNALYIGMLKFQGYSQDTIDVRIAQAIEAEYALVGAEDAGCSIASGIDTALSGVVFRYRFASFAYGCSVQRDCQNVPNYYGDYTAGESCTLDAYGYPVCTSNLPVPTPPYFSDCILPPETGSECGSEAVAHAKWELNSDVVGAIVRADLDRFINHFSGWSVPDPLFCSGQNLVLFPWSEMCVDGCGIENLARSSAAVATQSSTAFGGSAGLAIDGNTDGNFSDGSVSHTDYGTGWWMLDLGFVSPISHVDVWNRADCCADRLADYFVEFSKDTQNWFPQIHVTNQAGYPARVDVPGEVTARYVRIRLNSPNYLSLAEVQVYPPGQ